ncbi:hypothetical protein PLICRDRAFT_38210 [Plicaturopsis crispa FD-325 SS-3]|nr:hypothetical protein PLICRDRAFT_38210 [Plicaturopsis crispa FD-325 SS-3]
MASPRRRSSYAHFETYPTRWSDNDQYGHVNNAVYYHLFDAAVNTYLIKHCNLDPQSPTGAIALVVSSFCQFYAPLSFPQRLVLGLRVTKLGKSSVSYELGVFPEDAPHDAPPAAVGGYTHVFVDSVARRSVPMDARTRRGLEALVRREPGDAGAPDARTKL